MGRTVWNLLRNRIVVEKKLTPDDLVGRTYYEWHGIEEASEITILNHQRGTLTCRSDDSPATFRMPVAELLGGIVLGYYTRKED